MGLGFADRYAGFDAVPAAILLALTYGTLVAAPIQLLHRELYDPLDPGDVRDVTGAAGRHEHHAPAEQPDNCGRSAGR